MGLPLKGHTLVPLVPILRYPGMYHEHHHNLYYNHNRWYDYIQGRYLEPDPIGLEGGLNQYAYANNNPVMNVDPTGLCTGCDSWSWGSGSGFSPNQTSDGIQNHFNYGSGAFNVDPKAFSIERMVDVDKQIYSSLSNSTGFMRNVADNIHGIGKPVNFTNTWSFNGESAKSILNGSWPLGRMAGVVSGTYEQTSSIQYKVTGRIDFGTDSFNWNTDNKGLANAAIYMGGLLPSFSKQGVSQWKTASPSHVGGAMQLNYNRSLYFTTTGMLP